MSTKAELKENILAHKLEGVVTWAVANRSTVLLGLGIFMASVLISSVFIIRRREANTLSQTRLAQAQSFLSQQKYEQAEQILNEIASSPSQNETHLNILYHQGLTAIGMKNYEKAGTSFQQVMQEGKSSPLRPLALSNMAYIKEELKKYDEAASLYGQFMAEYADHFLAARTQLLLGKNLALAGKKEDATKALQQLVDLYPTSPWAENARSFLDKNKTR